MREYQPRQARQKDLLSAWTPCAKWAWKGRWGQFIQQLVYHITDLGFSLGTNEVLRNGCRWKISTADRALWKLGEELMLGVRSSAQLVKNLPATWETWVWSLGGGKNPLEKEKASHSSILAWRIPWTIQSMGSQRVGHNWATSTFKEILLGEKQQILLTKMHSTYLEFFVEVLVS